jgi:hypothetical protein
MSRNEIASLVAGLGNYLDVLRQADARDKAELYAQLNLRLTYRPKEQTVRAEARLDPHSSENGSCPRGVPNRSPNSWRFRSASKPGGRSRHQDPRFLLSLGRTAGCP